MKRWWIQLVTTLVTNIKLDNFLKGNIYTGNFKSVCVPGLNCYSCPGAIGSCPIGALQSVSGSVRYQISLYVLGLMVLFGTVFGRFICGWLCPFGWVQDLLYKIKSKKFRLYKLLKYIKYFILFYFVFLFPILFTTKIGLGDPGFCKFICPSGTLFAAIPLLIANPNLRTAIGVLFNLKMAILLLVVIGSIYTYRIFCKILCPLGAFYSVFNKVSFYQFKVNETLCIQCENCVRVCKMEIVPYKSPNHLECIRCGDCISNCPTQAITKIKHFEKPVQIELS